MEEIKVGMKDTAEVINNNFEELADRSMSVLLKGFWYMNADTLIKPSKALSDCKTGWVLQWQPTNEGKTKINANFHHTHIPKAILDDSGASVLVPLFSGVGQVTEMITKSVYVSNTGIQGHANNSLATDNDGKGTKHWVLVAVYEY